jgi:hypothetical protein
VIISILQIFFVPLQEVDLLSEKSLLWIGGFARKDRIVYSVFLGLQKPVEEVVGMKQLVLAEQVEEQRQVLH